MDRLEAFSVLLTAVESGSLAAAGRRLGKPLTKVSRKLYELEAHLNIQLVNRANRQLELTDAGRIYVAACKSILKELREAERSVTGGYNSVKRDLVIAAPTSFGRLYVVPIVAQFLKVYPGMNVELVLADRTLNFLDKPVDLEIRVGKLPDNSLVAIRVGATRRVVCGSPSYFAIRGTPKIPSELGAHVCVTFRGWMSPDTWTFRCGKSKMAVAIQSRLVVNTPEAALDAAIAGTGVTCALSYQIQAAVDAAALRVVLQEFEPAAVPVHLVYAASRHLPPNLRAFCEFAAPRLKQKLSDTVA
jgi:DNA-binding transcriptional LysR family regulator